MTKTKAERARDQRSKRRERGQCYECQQPSVPGRSRCAGHLAMRSSDQRRHYHSGIGRDRQYMKQREVRELVASLKTQCSLCGETHPACLQFHHRNPAEKQFDIALAARKKPSLETLMAEVAKCEVLCANCHAKLHWKERNGEATSTTFA